MGDVIIRAGGKDLSTPGDLRNAIEDNIDKGIIELEIIRKESRRIVKTPILIEEL